MEDFQDALKGLEQYYTDICKKIDKRIEEENQAMYGWMKNDEEEYDELHEPIFEDIADDGKEEWEEEYLADYFEYVQDWDTYTMPYN